MATKTIEVAGIGQLNLYKRRNARSIRITILPSGGVRVTVPSWLPYKAGIEYAKSKADWINSHQTSKVYILDGRKIGKYHRLNFESKNSATVSARVTETDIKVAYSDQLTIQHNLVQTKALQAAEKALRSEAQVLLPQRLNQLAAKYGYNYSGVTIKKLKSRWGSCNHNKNIALNFYLMQLPWQLIDYVLIHELNHTKHLNHSQNFWADLLQIMPEAKALRRQLRQYQPTL